MRHPARVLRARLLTVRLSGHGSCRHTRPAGDRDCGGEPVAVPRRAYCAFTAALVQARAARAHSDPSACSSCLDWLPRDPRSPPATRADAARTAVDSARAAALLQGPIPRPRSRSSTSVTPWCPRTGGPPGRVPAVARAVAHPRCDRASRRGTSRKRRTMWRRACATDLPRRRCAEAPAASPGTAAAPPRTTRGPGSGRRDSPPSACLPGKENSVSCANWATRSSMRPALIRSARRRAGSAGARMCRTCHETAIGLGVALRTRQLGRQRALAKTRAPAQWESHDLRPSPAPDASLSASRTSHARSERRTRDQ